MTPTGTADRLAWVDIAKGICILLVVLMHATLGVEKATGTETALNSFIMWAKPFRMPDFFLISGLFLSARIARPWPAYLDTKVVHFAYFYALWYTILYVVKGVWLTAGGDPGSVLADYLMGYLEPYSSLWFIYLLAVFFVITKLLENVPQLTVVLTAAMIHAFAPHTGSMVLDEFASRFVFFYSGYILAPHVLAFAAWVFRQPKLLVLAAIAVWAALNWLAVTHGVALVPGPDLPFSFAGIAAVIALSVVLQGLRAGRWFEFAGRNSLAVFLAFPLFIGPARHLMLKLGAEFTPEIAALVSAAAGIGGSLLLERLVRGTRLDFLFKRPAILTRRAGAPRPQDGAGSLQLRRI